NKACALSVASAQRLEPDLDLSAARAAVFVREEGWVSPRRWIGRLLDSAVATGRLVVQQARVDTGEPGRSGVCLIGSFGRLVVDRAVIAAGAATAPIVAASYQILSFDLRPGVLALTRPANARLQCVVYADDVHLRPDGEGRILAGLLDGGDKPQQLSPERVQDQARDISAKMVRWLPVLAATPVEAIRVGVRCIPADGDPVLGWLDEDRQVYVAVMHSGMTLAPYLSRLAADDLAKDRPHAALRRFRPDRFVAAGRRAMARERQTV